MKHFIRIVQTDAIGIPEMHEDKTNVINDSFLSAKVISIKNSLIDKMVAKNYKFQRHYHDHKDNGLGEGGCKLEDI